MSIVPLVSLCIPTNGVVEWVFPTLDSIYEQGVSNDLFEVIITDNGNNVEFEDKMLSFLKQHPNTYYYKTDALPFLNEIEAYKRANGVFIKYLNHRTMLLPKTLPSFIDAIHDNLNKKPAFYFSNGVIKGEKNIRYMMNFDDFIRELGLYSSWSTGMAFWKEDFDKVDLHNDLNTLFPHTKILFNERDKNEYIIDNRVMLYEQPVGTIPKAHYDIFYAFAIDFPAIILDLYRDNSITIETFRAVNAETLDFVSGLYLDYIVRRIPCSYDLSGFNSSIGVFYSKMTFDMALLKCIAMRMVRKARRSLNV